MTDKQIIEGIKVYSGNDVYINALKPIVLENKELNLTQKLLAKQFLVKHAIKTNNPSLLPKEELKQFKIDWKQYEAKEPYNFQKEGINWLLNKDRGILGDDLGLGKTFQSIIAALETGCKKILVICPASLKLNWRKELMPFTQDVSVITKKWEPARFTIINYDILPKYLKEIEKYKVELLIADEAHYAKNSTSKRSKAVAKIAKKAKRVWLLTGTPIANKPIDFYNLLKICSHELGKNKAVFGENYCGGVKTPWGFDYNGASNLKELHFKTKNIILRRKKEEVLDLPPKVRTPMYLELSNKRGYDNALVDYYFYKSLKTDEEKSIAVMKREIFGDYEVEESDRGNETLVELSALRKFTAVEKIKDGSTIELVDSVLDQGKRVVVFTNYIDVIDGVKKHYDDKCVTLDGRLSLAERQERIDLFQSGQGPDVVVCNLAIAAVGITLTKATVAIMNDLSWSPSVMMQAEDRIYRIGQTDSVDILYPIYEDTIDDVMFEVLKEKIKNINKAIEGKSGGVFGGDMSKEVYRILKNKK
jgi:SWI/SNF-related matrix-associated actin-dependent regulator of chromatin subfamily A-like protein 1